ncbi:MAG: hypothetical protein QNJ49_15475 [Mastigocoleus sp. MO_167.B18]|nr:hypothetical protein [Mastigocoleus sp. MO_167.B18]
MKCHSTCLGIWRIIVDIATCYSDRRGLGLLPTFGRRCANTLLERSKAERNDGKYFCRPA